MAETTLEELCDSIDAETSGRVGAPCGHPEFDRLVRTMWRLRQPDGCPWDKAQTHESISRNMVEETYEAVEAIREGSIDHLVEELGDMLEQILLQAQIGADGHLKSHPVEHLQDEGVFNAKDMTELYRHFLQKTLIDYSHNERKFIGEVGGSAYSLTIRELLNRACMEIRRKE